MSAKQKLSPPPLRGRLFLFSLLGFLFLCGSAGTRADSLEDAARDLARKMCAAPRQRSMKINWQVSPELSGPLSDSLKRAFLLQLSACGMDKNNNSDSPLLSITIRVTASKLVLVASLEDSGGNPQIRMTETRRDTLSISNEFSRTPRLQRKLLWQQERPLESGMEWYGRSTQEHFLFLVSQGSIVRLRSTNEVWTQVDSAGLPKPDRPSRLGSGDSTFMFGNPEAETKLDLFISRAGAPIYRKLCEFDPAGSLSLACSDSYLGGKQLRISSECGGTPSWSLWTDTGDHAQRDRIFYGSPEVAEAELPADERASHSIELPGPVLDVSATQDSMAAIAVVRNISTGNYEVYRITLACAN